MSFRAVLLGLLGLLSPLRAQEVVTALPLGPAPSCPLADDYCRCGTLERAGSAPLRVCRVFDGERLAFTLLRGDEEIGRWTARTADPGPLGPSGGLHILHGDLDGQPPAEIVVAHLDGMSMGMGVAYWTLFILPDNAQGAVAPLTLATVELGPQGLVQRTARGLSLLTTEWVSSPDVRGRRGEGLYLVGRPMRYQAGTLEPDLNASVRARRYLEGFERERGASADNPRIPAVWLAHRLTETRRTDPIVRGTERTEARGTIQRIERPNDGDVGDLLQLTLTAADGTSHTYRYTRFEPFEGTPALAYIGDARHGRIYPTGYLPADVHAWLLNRTGRVATYGDPAYPRRVLWLE